MSNVHGVVVEHVFFPPLFCFVRMLCLLHDFNPFNTCLSTIVNGHCIESHILTYFARQQMLNTALVRHLPYLEVTRPCSVLVPNCTYQNKLAMDRKKMAMLDTLLLLLLLSFWKPAHRVIFERSPHAPWGRKKKAQYLSQHLPSNMAISESQYEDAKPKKGELGGKRHAVHSIFFFFLRSHPKVSAFIFSLWTSPSRYTE